MHDREAVIRALEYLISEDCTENQFDYADEIETAIALLKEHEAVEPYMDYDGHDVWRCGNCGATIFHIEHSQADEDWKSYAKFCRQCGKKVKWDD